MMVPHCASVCELGQELQLLAHLKPCVFSTSCCFFSRRAVDGEDLVLSGAHPYLHSCALLDLPVQSSSSYGNRNDAKQAIEAT